MYRAWLSMRIQSAHLSKDLFSSAIARLCVSHYKKETKMYSKKSWSVTVEQNEAFDSNS